MPKAKKDASNKAAKQKKMKSPSSIKPVTLRTTPVAEFVMPSQNDKKFRGWLSRNKKRLAVVAIFLVVAILPSLYFYNKYQDSQAAIKNPTAAQKDEATKLVLKVKKHVVLPDNEDPVIATVNDINQFKNQTFFAEAQNGDNVLVYAKAKKAVLYRPSIDRVINMLPLTVETTPQQ